MIEQYQINKITKKVVIGGEYLLPFNTDKYVSTTEPIIFEPEERLSGKTLCELFRNSVKDKYTLLQQCQMMKAVSYLWELIGLKGELTVEDYNEFREVLVFEISSLAFVNITEINQLLDYIYMSNGFLGE